MSLAGGVLDFSLTSFATPNPTNGICSTTVALSAGDSCIVAAGSPFLFFSAGTTTTLSFDALGVLTDTGNSSTNSYSGLFTSQLTATTSQLAAAIDTGGFITSTYSATLNTGPGTGSTTPEPATLTLLGTGLALFAGIRKRFVKA